MNGGGSYSVYYSNYFKRVLFVYINVVEANLSAK
jgi:hypothetical protein